LVGGVFGAMAGYYSGRSVRNFIGQTVMRLADIIQAFPVFILALGLVAVVGPSAKTVAVAIAFVNLPIFLRLFRAEALSVRERAYVDAARAGGVSDRRILARHVVPNAIGPAFVQISTGMGFAILLTAGLSFVGAGVRAPTPEWGSMIAIGAPNIVTGQWWPALFPGIWMGITILSLGIVGQSLEMLTDPRRRV
jgi:peptide/nickel transport system permease protein